MADRTAVLVTGSREWPESQAHIIRDRLSLYPRGTIVLHGGARGADTWAVNSANALWMIEWELPYFADLGKRGGPARNAVLVDILGDLWCAGFKCAVEAFPIGASVGTRGCVAIARRKFAAGTSARPILIHETEGK